MADRTNFDASKKFVEFGLREKALGRRESASGPGSFLAAAREAMDFLRRIIAEHKISSVLDLGCGDWNWMQHMGFPQIGGRNVSYVGWDSHEQLIAELTKKFERDGVEFQARDIVTDDYPQADLIIARDVLFHIPTDMSLRIVERARRNARYFLSTSFPEIATNTAPAAYLPIDGWGFYEINLNAPPFSLGPAMIESVEETKCKTASGHKRYVCLYDLAGDPNRA